MLVAPLRGLVRPLPPLAPPERVLHRAVAQLWVLHRAVAQHLSPLLAFLPAGLAEVAGVVPGF